MDNLRVIKKLYQGRRLVTLYTYLRFWEDNRYRRIEKMLPKKGRFIDMGCGLGIFSNYLALCSPKRKILGLEFGQKKIKIAQQAAQKGGLVNASFAPKNITKAKIPKVDVIIIMHVLHHLNSFQEQERLLRTCLRKLKKGGILLIDEVEKNFSLRYFLAILTDNLLYPGDTFYFKDRTSMLKLLKQFPLEVEVKDVSDFLMPYPEIIYLCQKK